MERGEKWTQGKTEFNSLEEFVMGSVWTGSKELQVRYLQVNGKIDCDTFKYESGLDSVIQQVSTRINANDSTFPIMEKLEPRWAIRGKIDGIIVK